MVGEMGGFAEVRRSEDNERAAMKSMQLGGWDEWPSFDGG